MSTREVRAEATRRLDRLRWAKEFEGIPERLQRLDRELISREKDFDYLYAVRNHENGECVRIKCCVMRIQAAQPGDYQFIATCSFGGRIHRQHAHLPREAFQKIAKQLKYVVDKVLYERNLSKSGRAVV